MRKVTIVGGIFVLLFVLAIVVHLNGWFTSPLDKNADKAAVCYENAWILEVKEGKVSFFAKGEKMEYDIHGWDEEVSSCLADITIWNNQVRDMNLKKDKIKGKVLAVGEDWIDIESYGKVYLTENYRVYKDYDGLEEKSLRDIVVGYDNQSFVTQEDKICGVVIENGIEVQNIRVLLHNTNYAGVFHDKVEITCKGKYTVQYGKETKNCKAGKKLNLKEDSELLKKGRVIITSDNEKNRLQVSSIQRDMGTPSYEGSIEVAVTPEGLVIINELSMENYLKHVVPSEMPSSYEKEALRAQAVCARSYAYKHVMNHSYSQFGAHVDDSTNYQVYNNIDETAATNKAVKDTYGTIMMHNNEPISAYFFGTSCGVTTDAQVWGSDLGYVKGTSLLTGKDKLPDLSDEDAFKQFITGAPDSYDFEYPMYRWQISGSKEDLAASINYNLPIRYQADPNSILVLGEDGEYESKEIDTIGKLKKIELGERGTNGVLQYVIIKGSKNTIKILREYNIRCMLNLSDHVMVLHDGTSQNAGTMLPSGFFTIQKNDDMYTFYGGGYGHGVGMSQNGANGMAKKGFGYKKILKKYYNDIEFEKIY